MITFFWGFFKNFGFKNFTIAALILGLVFCATEWRKASLEAKNIKTVYEHPETKTLTIVKYKEGPVRIKTVVVKEDKKETTTTEEFRDGTGFEETNTTELKPVPVSVVMKPFRTDRWLLTGGVNKTTADFEGKALLAGYGWNNRFDLQAGLVRTDRSTVWVFGTVRF